MDPATADTPIPSIEAPADVDQHSDRNPSPTSRDEDQFSSPSTLVLTPVDASIAGSSGDRSGSPGLSPEAHTNLANELSSMRLSPANGVFDMSRLAQTVDLAARTPNRRASSSPNLYDVTPTTERIHTLSPSPQPRSNIGRRLHQVHQEEPPPDSIHSDQFQQAFSDSKTLMAEMEEVLQSSPLHADQNSTIHRLHHEAAELASFQYPSSRIVGLVGESGVGKFLWSLSVILLKFGTGKSSLLNSLLDVRDLARTVSGTELFLHIWFMSLCMFFLTE